MEPKIIFATGNENKMKEIRMILSDLGMPIQSMKEAGIDVDVVEDGSTFEENALIKATEIAKIAGNCIVLADDSGLEIDYLNKEPGIYSARYAGVDTSYDIKNNMLLDRLKGVPDEKRTARFVCAVAAAFPDGTTEVVRGTIEGRIGYEIAGEHGFGYDPIFYLPEYGCTTAELDPEKKNELSHRGKALRAMREIMEKKLMRVLIVSDTHGSHRNLDAVLERVGKIDALIHMGDVENGEHYIEAVADCETYMVAGNNDFFSFLPKEREFTLGKYNIFITHGHNYYVSMGTARLKKRQD